MPLTVVLIISLYDGRVFSPKYSHSKLPKAAKGADSQKLYPLERAALKITASGVRMHNKVHAKSVSIPFPASLYVMLPGIESYPRKVIVENISIDCKCKNISSGNLQSNRHKGSCLLNSELSFRKSPYLLVTVSCTFTVSCNECLPRFKSKWE